MFNPVAKQSFTSLLPLISDMYSVITSLIFFAPRLPPKATINGFSSMPSFFLASSYVSSKILSALILIVRIL